MGNMDATIRVPIHIINPYSENTIVQVDVSHLNKRIEVVIPNNIQPGHIIRLKGLGYGGIGDLLIEISSITLGSSDNTTKQTERKKRYDYMVQRKSEYWMENELCEMGSKGWRCISITKREIDYDEYLLVFEKEVYD